MIVTSAVLTSASQTIATAIINTITTSPSPTITTIKATTTTNTNFNASTTTTTTNNDTTPTTAAIITTTTAAEALRLPVEELSLAMRVALAMVLAAAVVVATVGNGVVCALVYRKAAMRSAINLLVAQLALSDMLLGLLVLPPALVGMFLDSPSPSSSSSSTHSSSSSSSLRYPRDELCALGSLLQEILVTVNVCLLLAVSLDRYLIIVHRQERLNVRRARIVILLAWLLAFLAALPPVLGWGQFSAYPGHPQCPDLLPHRSAADEIYVVLRCLLTRYLPSAAILYCYARILSAVRRKSVKVHNYAVDVGVTQCSGSAALPRPQPRISVTGALREFSSTDGEQFTATPSMATPTSASTLTTTPSPAAVGDFSSTDIFLSDTMMVMGGASRKACLKVEQNAEVGGKAYSKRHDSGENRFSFIASSVASPTTDLFSPDCFQGNMNSVAGSSRNFASFSSEHNTVASSTLRKQLDTNSKARATGFPRSSSCCLSEIRASATSKNDSPTPRETAFSPGPFTETARGNVPLCSLCAKAQGGRNDSVAGRRHRSFSSGSSVCFMSSNSSVFIHSPSNRHLAGRAHCTDTSCLTPVHAIPCHCATEDSPASENCKQEVAKMPSVSPEMPSIIRRRLEVNALKLQTEAVSCRRKKPTTCHSCHNSIDAGSVVESASCDNSLVVLSCRDLAGNASLGDCVCFGSSQKTNECAGSEHPDISPSSPPQTTGQQHERATESCLSDQNPLRVDSTCGRSSSPSFSTFTRSADRKLLHFSLNGAADEIPQNTLSECLARSSPSAPGEKNQRDNPFCVASFVSSSSSNPAPQTTTSIIALPNISSSCPSCPLPDLSTSHYSCCLSSVGGVGHNEDPHFQLQQRTSTCLFSPARNPSRLIHSHSCFHSEPHRTPSYLSSPSGLSPSAKGVRRTAGARRQVMQDMSLRTRAFKTILILSLLLCACWTPHATAVMVTCLLDTPSPGLLCLLLWLGFVKSALNPVVYCMRIRKFRDACKEAVPSSCHSCCVFPPRCMVLVAKRRVNPSAVYQCAETSLS